MKRFLKSSFAASVALLAALPAAFAADDAAAPVPSQADLKFSFGPQAVPGYTHVGPNDNYTVDRGYGFDLGCKVVESAAGSPGGSVTGANGKAFFFSVKLVPGVYQVSVTLGDPQKESLTYVKSETRRLMLEAIKTAAGKPETKTFLVHIRVPQIPGGGIVALKPRERDLQQLFLYWEDDKPLTFYELDWDEKLTLEFSGTNPSLAKVEIKNAEKPVTVYLIGDSTVTDQMMEPWGAWGMHLPRWFKPPVVIANYAESGETTQSFIGERRWPKLLSEIHSGDYVLMQFGINDRRIPIDQFKEYFRQFIKDTRDHGATPVLVSSQNLRSGFFNAEGKPQQTLAGYPYAMWEVAVEQKVPFIDLNSMSMKLYAAIGQEKLPKAFVDGTHQNTYGAYELAKCVVNGIKDAKLPIADYIVDDWKPYDPEHPLALEDFNMPPDPQLDPKRPGGPGGPAGEVPVAGAPAK